MDNYTIRFATIAYKDLEDVYKYIRNELKEPNIAVRTYNKIVYEIKKLEFFPKRHPIIQLDSNPYSIVRILSINKIVALYVVDDDEKVVRIKRILYGASNWEEKLWLNMDKVNIKISALRNQSQGIFLC